MKTPRILTMNYVQKIRSAVFCTAAIVLLVGCGKVDIKWTEELVLEDGRTLLLNRSAQGKTIGELGGSGGWEATQMTLEVETPKSPLNPPTWSQRWVPMLFDYDAKTKEWFVVATFYTCTDWYDLGRPKLPYIEYRARNGRWVEVPLSDSLFGRKSNLLTGMRADGKPKHVTVDFKNLENAGAGDSFKRILNKWHTSC